MKHIFTALFLFCLTVSCIAGINTWTQCSGTYGYGIECLLIDTTTSSRIYAGTYGGILKSVDYGTTWIYSAFTAYPNYVTASIAVNPKFPNIVYADLGYILKNTTYGYGDWITISDEATTSGIPEMPIDPENVGRMYVGSGLIFDPGAAFVFRSDDTGYHWEICTSGINTDQGLYVLTMHPTQHNWLYAGAPASPGIYVTVNGATSWNAMPFYNGVKSLVIDPTDTDRIYVGIATNGFASSFDGGSTWTYCTDTSITGYEPQTIIVNPLNPKIIYIGTSNAGIFKSKDRGNTWASLTTGLPFTESYSLAYDTITRTLFVGHTGDGITPPKGIWMYQDTDLYTPPDSVTIPNDIWQFFD